eukprot:CAMPEP_0113507844 /NCGR_PEP_ID=MMETSP0014_2-20120614/36686_1 /TAXON_ID=2857 /ORGANISM="Nitzschia sp." /LENGTH=2090 /DNA_ID=CAMNT_0000403489 /DNA_START=61 /DNA_END=6333 /DNA_ORIENTATION=+ /assembly_acc=CAM_ASM_000159
MSGIPPPLPPHLPGPPVQPAPAPAPPTTLWVMTPEEQASAIQDAKARGLPDGWTVQLDKRKRRKWTAPNGRSCDSIPKALAISVELGMLPPDFVLPTGPPKRKRPKQDGEGGTLPKKKTGPKKSKMLHHHQMGMMHSIPQPRLALDLTQPASMADDEAARLSSILRGSDSSSDSSDDDMLLGRHVRGVGGEFESDDDDEEDFLAAVKVKAKRPPTARSTPPTATALARKKQQPKKKKKKAASAASSKAISTSAAGSTSAPSVSSTGSRKTTKSTKSQQSSRSTEPKKPPPKPIEEPKPAVEEEEEEEDEPETLEPPTDPETTLERGRTHLTTVHWDPTSPAGKKIGWKIRISDDKAGDWKEGRIIRYDPCTHRHKIMFVDEVRTGDTPDDENCVWLHLRMEEGIQISTRLVWAHVKGYAWWPAMVMESDSTTVRDGFVHVEFFGSGEVATLRDHPDTIRTFENGVVDSVIQKNKKKRNAAAIALAVEEESTIRETRNKAAKFYATKAWHMANGMGKNLLGNRIEIWRDDVNYPYGDTVRGRVRQYSPSKKKWLVAFEPSDTIKKKYDSKWVNLASKEHKMRVLQKSKPDRLSDQDILPFVKGFRYVGDEVKDPKHGTEAHLHDIQQKCCSGCSDFWKKNENNMTCTECKGSYHLGCHDPPISKQDFQRFMYDPESPFVCSKCRNCRGCYQRDVAFGSQPHSMPKTLTFPDNDELILCSMCTSYYAKEQFCPNCAHSWDDEHFQHVQSQIRWQQEHRPKKRGRRKKSEVDDPTTSSDFYSFTAPATVEHEDPLPEGALVNPAWYHAETSQWGYTEVDMLTCDNCSLWVHAGCAGIDEDEYELTGSGDHPIYSKEFLCRICCRERCFDLISKMQQEDRLFLFAEPVSEKIAPNYLDVVKQPMDLQTMLIKAERTEYRNYAWVRELFELMVLNALTFNRFGTTFWNEARRFHKACLTNAFSSTGKAAPPSQYESEILEIFEKAQKAKRMEEDRVQAKEGIEQKDLVAGSKVQSISLPELRKKPPDQPSCIQCHDTKLRPRDAYYNAWMECCFTCGSTGASDTMLFCVDCGEGFHSFCVNAPVHSMDTAAAASWRCPNCKICEISGEVPQDDKKMLFCEMCDRGFNMELLDPPLAAAPPGVWICGQCVDCHNCRGNNEAGGASLQHWSREPNLCYRCGGCEGLIDQYLSTRKCSICAGYWRDGDTDLAECIDCKAKVHGRCDSKAYAYLKTNGASKASDDARSDDHSSYHCPTCRKRQGISKDDSKITRAHMADHCWKIIESGGLDPTNTVSKEELYDKLMEQSDWKTRNLWRDEYRKVVLEGVRFMSLARQQFGDPRYLMERFWQENEDLPAWMGQRATRFLHIANKLKLDTLGFSARRIENCVMVSKLAASWLKVSCRMMGLKTKKNVKGYERVMKLLVKPHESGSIDLAFDTIRCERNRNIINKDDWMKIYEPRLKPIIQQVVFSTATSSPGKHNHRQPSGSTNAVNQNNTTCALAQPLCGWNGFLNEDDFGNKWKDTRECALCRTCGDDDAGLEDEMPTASSDRSKPVLAKVGRLLPMGDGLWVHTFCALWSSETWEAENGGLIHAVERARSRGAQLRCFGCGRPGATVGCAKQNCNCNYHFPCAFACGAVFTTSKHIFCPNHKDEATEVIQNPSSEPMKTLIVANEKSNKVNSRDDQAEPDTFFSHRLGALTVHSLGEIEQDRDGFHSTDYVMPSGFTATRISWSTAKPRTRTVYVLKVEKSAGGKPVFTITPGDDPVDGKIKASSPNQAYSTLMERVNNVNASHFSQGDMFSKLPTQRKNRAFGMNGPQFFGFGLDHVRKILEALPGTAALVTRLTDSSPQYLFCNTQPSLESITDLQRKRAAIDAEKRLENATGCARTEGITAVARSGGSDRITRALVRRAENEEGNEGANVSRKAPDSPEKVKADRSRTQRMYRALKAVPIEQRLFPQRSHIHGWGLFSRVDISKDGMIVEYMGEIIRKDVADRREKDYEVSGEGSCYMFRLDLQRIVDATRIGSMARFMNHCCQPNAYAKVIHVDTEFGPDKKIVVYALRDIKAGEEITYDYKFPIEDGSVKCTCGAPNCIGRMN